MPCGPVACRPGRRCIVLNGRRPPDSDAEEAIEALRQRGADVRVQLADMSDPAAIDAMLARLDADMPPLAGLSSQCGRALRRFARQSDLGTV